MDNRNTANRGEFWDLMLLLAFMAVGAWIISML